MNASPLTLEEARAALMGPGAPFELATEQVGGRPMQVFKNRPCWTRLDADGIRSFVAEKLAYFKVPAHVEVRSEALPRNATGKVLKNVLTGDAENPFTEE